MAVDSETLGFSKMEQLCYPKIRKLVGFLECGPVDLLQQIVVCILVGVAEVYCYTAILDICLNKWQDLFALGQWQDFRLTII